MTRILWITIILSLSTSIFGQSPTPTPFRCSSKSQSHKKVLSLNSSGESVEGPVCAEISINALRYGAEFGETITISAGPNLGSIFPTSFSASSGTNAMVAQPGLSLNENFVHYNQVLDTQERSIKDFRAAAATLDAALHSLKDLVIQSDTIFTNQGATGVINLIKSDSFKNALKAASDQKDAWKNSDEILNTLRTLQANLNALPALYPTNTETITAGFCDDANIKKLGWPDWSSKCRDADYKQAQARVARLITEVTPFSSDGEKVPTIAKKLGVAAYWQTTSKTLSENPDYFVRQHEVSCPVLFNQNRQVALKLLLKDFVPTFELQDPTITTKDNLLLVQCGSRFSISAGVAFSGISNTEFAIVKGVPSPSGTTSTSRFGILSDPKTHPIPIAVAHARLLETNDHKYAFHFSFGVGVNARSQASGGSSPEFLVGPSVSFLRTIYVTGGAAIGKATGLAGGFRVNDLVPSDVTAPQIVSSYVTRWGIAITFTRP